MDQHYARENLLEGEVCESFVAAWTKVMNLDRFDFA